MSMALFTHPPSTLSTFTSKPHFKPHLTHLFKKSSSLLLARSTDNGAGVGVTAAVEEKVVEKKEEVSSKELKAEVVEKKKEEVVESNGASLKEGVISFSDPRWVGGTWDLKQFGDVGKTDWDAVIEAEARRRKFLEDNPESSNNENPVIFDTSIIPWWAWVKKYHLPEAELLNGRAAMIGFFMAYFVDSLTGVGLVNQMGNFFCKTLLFVAVVGVLVIRKNEDLETVKKLIEETTFYDKQWQATWKDDTTSDSNKE